MQGSLVSHSLHYTLRAPSASDATVAGRIGLALEDHGCVIADAERGHAGSTTAPKASASSLDAPHPHPGDGPRCARRRALPCRSRQALGPEVEVFARLLLELVQCLELRRDLAVARLLQLL